MQQAAHNHEATQQPGAHAAIRKLYKGKEFREKTAAHEAAGMLARYTQTIN
jgi:hypothetical protein